MNLVTVQGSMRLEAAAAAAWDALVDDVRAMTGVTLTITSPGGAYRDEAMVVDMWLHPDRYGATKGTARPTSLGGPGSVHETGRCVDINNWEAVPGTLLIAVAARHGFHRTIPAEPWHFEHTATSTAGTDTTPLPEEDTMKAIVVIIDQNRVGKTDTKHPDFASTWIVWPWGAEQTSQGYGPRGDLEGGAATARALGLTVDERHGDINLHALLKKHGRL